MKKILFTLGIFLLSISSISFGAASIGDISLRFCNNTGTLEKSLLLNISGQEEKDICMQLINGGNENMDINLNFVDGTVTNDTDQKKACKNEGENQNFGKYITRDNKPISVPARGNTQINAKLLFPEEVAGEVHGCVTYSIINASNNSDMFTIQVRRANFIDSIVKGIVTIGLKFDEMTNQENNISNNKKILSYYNSDEKKLYIQSTLRNLGTAQQNIKIKGTISSRLGRSQTFIEEDRNIIAKESSNLSNVVDNLPFYKGPFTIKYTVTHDAVVADGMTSDDNNKSGELIESASVVIMTTGTYMFFGILLIIILVILFFLIRRKHNHPTVSKNTKKIATKPSKKTK